VDDQLVALGREDVDDRRCVVARILPVNRVVHDGLAEVSFFVALAYALVYGRAEGRAFDRDFVALLHEENRESAVLAEGVLALAGHGGVLD
jgi:hypothetical protein